MTLNITIYAIMAAFFGLGIFLIVASFAIPRVMSNRFVEDADGTKRIGSVAEAQVLSAMVADLGKTIGKEKGDLEELLRKSGYIYQSSQEYYARRIYTSLITAVLGGALGYFLDLGFLIIAEGEEGVLDGFLDAIRIKNTLIDVGDVGAITLVGDPDDEL